jgi:hypothetical protein
VLDRPSGCHPWSLYADGIVRAISGAKVFALVFSEHAIASTHVGKEIERASSKRRPIIALRIDLAPLTPAFQYFRHDRGPSRFERIFPSSPLTT